MAVDIYPRQVLENVEELDNLEIGNEVDLTTNYVSANEDIQAIAIEGEEKQETIVDTIVDFVQT